MYIQRERERGVLGLQFPKGCVCPKDGALPIPPHIPRSVLIRNNCLGFTTV